MCISSNDAIALANTSAFPYLIINASNKDTRFLVYESFGAISYILGTLNTAVLRT
jgi:hypothetical protein